MDTTVLEKQFLKKEIHYLQMKNKVNEGNKYRHSGHDIANLEQAVFKYLK